CADYMETRYEDLVQTPAPELAKVGRFLGCDLNYATIKQRGVGSIKNPLNSFKEDLNQGKFSPVGRWKLKDPAEQLQRLATLIEDYMQELGYALSGDTSNGTLVMKTLRSVYELFYGLKQWAKVNTPLSRMMVSYSDILIDK